MVEDYIEHEETLYYVKDFNVFSTCTHLKALWVKTGDQDD
jgi:hypothetical protein